MTEPFIFVSYRRDDTSPYALALKAELEHRLRAAFVFVDLQRIQATDRWSDVLDDALRRARVLIVMIGSRWMQCEDCTDRPRLFGDDDWVRKEVLRFMTTRPGDVLPLLIDHAIMPEAADLPPDIAGIAKIQAAKLDTPHWRNCIETVCQTLASRFGFELLDEQVKNPSQSAFRQLTPPIDDQTLQRALCEFLRGWRVELRYDRHGYGAMSQWLVKNFEFSSFELAMRFMQDGAEACRNLNHHPTWENTYKQVVVKMTTWNAAHRITQFDIELARRFDRIAANVIGLRADPALPRRKP